MGKKSNNNTPVATPAANAALPVEGKVQTSTVKVVERSWLAQNFEGKSEFVGHALILLAIFVLAFMVRLFSVVRYESMIHEFDPWFNFRSTKYLVDEGFYAFHNWFDKFTWYPLGRWVGNTVYPGLMWTSGAIWHFLHEVLHAPVLIRNVCVMLAPFMAGNTTIMTYLITKEISNGGSALFAAAFVAIAPGYISRSVAGSYDNECVAIFAMVTAFYLWVKAMKTGSMMWSSAAALGYFYMVSTWGGYIFVINLIPVHVFVLLLAGRYTDRLYVAYNTFFLIGSLSSMCISFVSWAPITSTEHLAAFGVFGLLQLYKGFFFMKAHVPAEHRKVFLQAVGRAVAGSIVLVLVGAITGMIPGLTGRLWALLGATSNIAIVKSVSEHQPSSWTVFFFDLHFLAFLTIVGMYKCFKYVTDASIFAILYIMLSVYFASIMVRLVLVLTPICCILGGIGANYVMSTFMDVLTWSSYSDYEVSIGKRAEKPRVAKSIAATVIGGFIVLCYFFVIHCNWVTSTAYSSPSIVLQATGHDGGLVIFDDFREAYTWLRHNTAEDARIMSWWDYGYQITGMGNRTTIVDNNTRNNTHIANVGLAMASSEERAYEVMASLDVDYALVVFGGRIGYSSDDINKFLWMVRISGGIFPEVVEAEYFSKRGAYTVDKEVSHRMSNSIMYKMCYYRFGETQTVMGRGTGYDRVRNVEIGVKDIKLTLLEEAFTTEHWMVRIYRVKREDTHPGIEEKIRLKKIGFTA